LEKDQPRPSNPDRDPSRIPDIIRFEFEGEREVRV
jgi:hypothetical protein